jgi:hypothetical protein
METVGVKSIESGEFSRFQKKPKNFQCGTNIRKSTSVAEPVTPQPNKVLTVKERHEKYRHKEESLNRFAPDISIFNSLKTDQSKAF